MSKNLGSLESKSGEETAWFHLNEHRWSERAIHFKKSFARKNSDKILFTL